MNLKTHVRPGHQTHAAHVFPRTQPGHAAGLLQLVVKRPELVALALRFGHVVKNKNKAVFAVDKHGACRHEPWKRHPFAPGQQRQTVHLAIAQEGLDQALAFVFGGPDRKVGGGAAHHGIEREAHHLAKRRVHVDIAAVGNARDTRRVGQGLVERGVFGLGRAQRVFDLAVGGDVHIHADQCGGAALGIAPRHGATRHHPAPLARRVHHAALGFVAFFIAVHGPGQPRGVALGVQGVAPGVPALPQVGRVGIGVAQTESFVKLALAVVCASGNVPLPAPATQRIECQAQFERLVVKGAARGVQRQGRLRLAAQQQPGDTEHNDAQRVGPRRQHPPLARTCGGFNQPRG